MGFYLLTTHHTHTQCSTICGLPFRNLDKKSEKLAMFSRRQQLSQALECATNGRDVLDLSVVLLFQQVRGIAVGGNGLMGPVMDLLLGEKKFPSSMVEPLSELRDCLSGSTPEKVRDDLDIDENVISAVRACGMCRDTSKY